MVLRMPCPTKRKGSDNWYFRRTIPADVQRILAKLPRSQRPRNWYAKHIVISLGTADRTLAKSKCPEVSAAVERQMKALREGPKPLTPKQIVALAGEAYKAFSVGLEEDPVLPPEEWRDIAEGIRAAAAPNPLLFTPDDPELRGQRLERHLGKIADRLIAKHAIVTDEQSRLVLIERLAIELPKASEKLARNADGDYSKDGYAERFPAMATARETPASKSLCGLAKAWKEAAIERGTTERTAKRFEGIVLRFVDWLGHDRLSDVVRADVSHWADARISEGIKPSTVNKVDTAALRTVFEWGEERGWLAVNPLTKAVRIKGREAAKVRDEYFTEGEIRAILSASSRVLGSKREFFKTTAAKRWVPWLLAYSGARVSEMIQIRKQDIRREAGAWIVRLTPAAGGIKTNKFRDVPVHSDLVKQGFIDFVTSSPDGHLFCRVPEGTSPLGAIEGVYSRIRKFVRTFAADPDVQPNHAWRYTFKTRGLEVGLEEIVLDALCGHGAKHKGRDYTKVTLKKRIDTVRKYPPYHLDNG